METINLDQLLAPLTKTEFLNSYWPQKFLFVPTHQNKLSQLLELPQLKSLESLIFARTKKVRACLPDFDDEYSSIHLEPSDALKAYRNNMTLVFDSMQTQDATIAGSLDRIRRDLGLVTGGAENDLCKARSIVYATPAGGGTRLHFDANANFVLQTRGTKNWILAPNISVENPTERFTVGADEMPAALENQCHGMLPNEIPADATEITMTPGCVLFVPRGYWHATTTNEDSLSLNFTFSQPTWADIFTKSLQEVLLKETAWRGLADGLDGDNKARQDRAIKEFESLVKILATDLPKLSGRDLLTAGGLLKN